MEPVLPRDMIKTMGLKDVYSNDSDRVIDTTSYNELLEKLKIKPVDGEIGRTNNKESIFKTVLNKIVNYLKKIKG